MVRLFDDVAQGGDELVMHGDAGRIGDELATLERRYDVARRRHTLMTGVATALTSLIASASVVGAVLLSARALALGTLAPSLIAVPALLSVASLELIGGVVPIMVGLRGDRASLARLEGLADVARPVREPAVTGPSVDDARGVSLVDTSLLHDAVTVVRRANLAFGPGELVVMSGPSGSGKTSIARLLAKFIDPSEGAIRLGDVDYGELSSHQVRSRVGSVDDAPHVFDTTLAGNLRIGRKGASDAELRQACHLAGLGPFLDALPDGLATQLGGLSTGLSGGEQRRLGVAREMLAERCVVIFDEPTEGLDEATGAELIDSIATRYRDGAVIVISHRGEDLRHATRKVTVVDGSLSEVDLRSHAAPS
jgi:ABC-type transport system involved in cytochrome bd biosynthesis fused ATPase/permease subunit